MQDFQGNDLQVGDTVTFYTTSGGIRTGMRNGVIMGILRIGAETAHIAQIATVGQPDQPLIASSHASIHRTGTDYRGSHPAHLAEIFPYTGKKALGDHTFTFGKTNTP